MRNDLATSNARRTAHSPLWQLFLAALVLLVAIPPAWSQQVSVDFDTEADFPSYKTFAWRDSDEDLRDSDPLFHDRVVRGIEQRLRGAGLSQVADDADLYVTYYTAEKQETVVSTTTMGYGYWGGGFGVSMGAPVTSTARTYTVGTLVVDLWDAEESKLVWRGIAEDTVSDNPQKNAKRIDKALDKLVKRWEREYRKVSQQE